MCYAVRLDNPVKQCWADPSNPCCITSMTVKRGILWFSVGTIGLLFVFVAFCWGVIQWRKSALEPVDPLPRLERAVVDANLPCPEGEALRRYLLDNPAIIAELMKSEDPTLRSAASDFLRWHLYEHPDDVKFKPDDAAKFVDSLRYQHLDTQRVLFWALGRMGPQGYQAITALFNDHRPLSAEQMEDMRWRFSSPDAASAIPKLVAIVENSRIPMRNRLQALEAISFSEENGRVTLTALQKLTESDDNEVSKAARIAIARIQDEPTIERILADLNWYQNYQPYAVGSYLLDMSKYGPAMRVAGPEVMRILDEPLNYYNNGYSAAITLAKIDYREAIPDLVSALGDKKDHYVVLGAIQALGLLKAKEAESELKRLSTESVIPYVRSAAVEAIERINGEERKASGDVVYYRWSNKTVQGEAYVLKYDWWCRVLLRYDMILLWRDLKSALIGLFSPRVGVVENAWDNTDTNEFEMNMLPRHKMRIPGGLLLGYDEGEFGSGLVFVKSGERPEFYSIPNVVKMLPWKDGAIVVTSILHYAIAYEVTYDPSTGLVVSPLTRLPWPVDEEEACGIKSGPNGSVLFPGGFYLTAQGDWGYSDTSR